MIDFEHVKEQIDTLHKRINVFEHEEVIDPRTVALMFQYMGRVGCSVDLNTKVGDDE